MACAQPSHMAFGAQPLERVLGLLILLTAGALGDAGLDQLGDDVVDRGGGAGDRTRARGAAERAIAPPVAREIELDDRDHLAFQVAPDVELGPVQQRMGADMDHRERHVAEERLAHHPQHDLAVLAERPQHPELVDFVESLAQDMDAARLKRVEMIHRICSSGSLGATTWPPISGYYGPALYS